jgi:hypothetical protein
MSDNAMPWCRKSASCQTVSWFKVKVANNSRIPQSLVHQFDTDKRLRRCQI